MNTGYPIEFDEEERALPAAVDIPLEVDPAVLAAREKRDQDVALANVLQGISNIGTAVASSGRVEADPSVYDALRKSAAGKAEEVSRDVASQRKTVSDYLKAKTAADKAAESQNRWQMEYDQRERLGKEAAAARGDARAEKQAAADEVRLNSDVQKLSKRIEDSGLGELDNAAKSLQTSLRLDDDKYDIPGFGKTYSIPEIALSNEGKMARQDVASLRNIILKARSGGAVTPTEADRLLQELGEGYTRDDNQLRRGVKSAIEKLREKSKIIQAGHSPRAVETYRSRGGTVPFSEPAAPQRKTVNGREYEKVDGGWRLVK